MNFAGETHVQALLKLLLEHPERFDRTDLPCCLRSFLDPDLLPDSETPCWVVKEPPKPHSTKPWSEKTPCRSGAKLAASPRSEFARTCPELHRPKLHQI